MRMKCRILSALNPKRLIDPKFGLFVNHFLLPETRTMQRWHVTADSFETSTKSLTHKPNVQCVEWQFFPSVGDRKFEDSLPLHLEPHR